QLHIAKAGPLVSVQDAGRFGYQRYGVTPAGPMDRLSFTIANHLLGQGPMASLEVGLGGLTIEATTPTHIAIAGPALKATASGVEMSDSQSLVLEAGEQLNVHPTAPAAFCYIAIAGGLQTAAHLGSRASHVRSKLGAPPIKAGDHLKVANQPSRPKCFVLPANAWPTPPARLRLLPGPQQDWFTDAAWAALTQTPYEISPRSDRMGYRLNGPELARAIEGDMVSDGIVTGAIQVPPNGAPILLMADRQTTGGYPKIAVMATADIPFAAQSLPGATLRFEATTMAKAVDALKTQQAWLAALPQILVAKISGEGLTSEALLAQNLVGGVVDARG
ncbi:MAG: biotin-dependent carboxyltransferase family protein, partial [Alphaproteobacteria bacterium]